MGLAFSIILPVHNGGSHVRQCMQSLLAQEHNNFNVLVLENKSTDGTAEWISSLKDDRVRIFPSSRLLTIEENWARILGIEKKEFITIIGHDDLLEPQYLVKMEELIHKHPSASLYQSHFTYIGGDNSFVRTCLPMDEVQHGHEFLACQMSRTMDSMGTGYMMRSKDYDEIGGIPGNYPNLIFADYQLWLQLSLLNYKATSPEFLFRYRVHDSTSRLTNGEQYQQAFEEYVHFLYRLARTNEKVRDVLDRYGHDFLLYFCEALSHRILKSAAGSRKTVVAAFIEKCKVFAGLLIPGQEFNPMDKQRIRLAKHLDATFLGRKAFHLFKKITG